MAYNYDPAAVAVYGKDRMRFELGDTMVEGGPDTTALTDEEIEDRLNRKVAESMMNVSFNPTPEFEDGKSAGNLRIENIPGNNYAFTVTIVRADTGEQILKTGLIDPGYYVQDIKLDKELPKGEYPCVATFTGYDPQTLQEIGETGSQLVITIKN